MKKINFLAALALPAMFAACTSEDLVFETPLQSEEIAGAELVGTGISMSVEGAGVDSRYANGAFETTDLLGLGWLTNGTPTGVQTEAATLKDVLYANNMFELQNGVFTTKGNVYKGWHFAYFPYERMESFGQKVVNINPAQDCLWEQRGGDRYHERFAVSARHYLTADNLDANNQLDENTKIKVEWATNEIVMELVPSQEFVNSTYLNELNIQNVTFSTGANVLAPYANLLPSKLPAAVFNEDGTPNDKETKEAVLAALPNVLTPAYYSKNTLVDGYTNSITTDVTVDMVTGTGGIVRVNTLPYATYDSKAKTNKVTGVEITPSIKVAVEGGYFTIKNVSKAAEGSPAAENNEALAQLIEAYAEDGKLAQVQGGIKVAFNLYPEIFTPDFKAIDDYKEWQKCVNIVKALGYTKEQTFNITGDIEVTGTTISMPKDCGIKVTGKKAIKINKTLKSWPAALNTAAVNVEFNADNTVAKQIAAKTITNNAVLTIAEGVSNNALNALEGTITNNGTIIVNKYAKVTKVANKGRIEIIYGGIAETTEETGVIFYTITGNESYLNINNLIEKGGVNTLVVNAGKTFDFNMNTLSSSMDAYDGASSTSGTGIAVANLQNITIEMNGGSVIGNLTKYEVKTIEVLTGNNNATTDVVAAAINVKAGKLTMDATSYGTPAVKNKLNLINTNVDVKKDAALVVNADTHVNTLANAGTVKANTGYVFHFNSGANSGTLTGDVEECDCVVPVDFASLEAAVKVAWENLLKNTAVAGNSTTAVEVIKGADLSNVDYDSVKFFNALKAWFEAKEFDFATATSEFDAAYIKMFNSANAGTENDLTI